MLTAGSAEAKRGTWVRRTRTPLSVESGLAFLMLLNVRDGHAICATGSHIIRLELAKAVAAAP